MALKANKLGEMLLEAGLIDRFQLESALSMQRNLGGRIGSALVKLGYLPEETILHFLETQEKYARISLADIELTDEILALLSFEKMLTYVVLPIELDSSGKEQVLRVAMTDPTNLRLLEALQFATGCRVLPVVAGEEDILAAIGRQMKNYPAQDLVGGSDEDDAFGDLLGDADEALVGSGMDYIGGRAKDDTYGTLASAQGDGMRDPRFDQLLELLHAKGILSLQEKERVRGL